MSAGPELPICSARGCRAGAAWVLEWNNPRLHDPDRRKTWLACDEHRDSLGEFLRLRGFLRDVVALAEWRALPRHRRPEHRPAAEDRPLPGPDGPS